MLNESQLLKLAEVMTASASSQVGQAIDAGYTYLGQFISHDSVPPTQVIPGHSRTVLPHLNLDSVYGTGAQTATLLDARGMFPIRRSTPKGPEDLPRIDGVPQIPELRNDDNVIVAQLHLFWQRLHNVIVDRRYATDVAEARRFVTLIYQLVVVEDYLRLVLAPSVFDSCFRFDERPLKLPAGSIPPEFALAAFRFGHSMVRPFYERACPLRPDINLKDLFQSGRNLDPTLEVNFRELFGWPVLENDVEDAMFIDPFVTGAMRQVPIPGGGTINIAEKNLRAAAGLPSGKAYVEKLLAGPRGPALRAAFGLTPLSHIDQLAEKLPADLGITIDNLPLWPYVLVEAAQAGRGEHLGMLGSLICAEVLANAIAGAQNSIYRDGWRSVDEVLSGLGDLGTALQELRRKHANAGFSNRTFCMRHVIELVH